MKTAGVYRMSLRLEQPHHPETIQRLRTSVLEHAALRGSGALPVLPGLPGQTEQDAENVPGRSRMSQKLLTIGSGSSCRGL
jgi:hypothetical protein